MMGKHRKGTVWIAVIAAVVLLVAGGCAAGGLIASGKKEQNGTKETILSNQAKDAEQSDQTEKASGQASDQSQDTDSTFVTTMQPYSGDLVGVHAGYAFVPIGGQTYRYDSESVDTSGVTMDELLLECTEVTELGDKYEWKFFSLKEYPGCEKILGVGPNTLLFAYEPAIGAEETEVEEAYQTKIVLMLNGSVVSGKELWEAFYTKVEKQEPATIDLGFLYRDNPERVSPELLAATCEDDPALFYRRVTYDGTSFTTEPVVKENGELIVKHVEGYNNPAATFQYLMHYCAPARVEFALYSEYDKYVLTNDDTVTWDDIEWGTISGNCDDYIDHEEVYCEYTWK